MAAWGGARVTGNKIGALPGKQRDQILVGKGLICIFMSIDKNHNDTY